MYDGDPTTVSESIPATGPSTHQFKFTGDAAEYFRIWIVNLCLSIITLGLYSPWAKVRKKRYFYGHTWVADSNFEYHGDPVAILKGRIVAVVALGIYSGAGYFSPKLAQVTLFILALLAPWIIARSMAFNAANSSYRQIRLQFKANYQQVLAAIWPFILIALVACFLPVVDPKPAWTPTPIEWLALLAPSAILVCAYPYVMGAIKRLLVNHSRYGTAPFAFSASISRFYKIYAIAAGIAIPGLLAAGAAIFFLISIPVIGWLAIPLIYFFFVAVLLGYIRSRITNLVLNSTVLADRVQFRSTQSAMGLANVYLCNLLAIAFTFGLLIPWAAVRVARYRAEALSLESSSDFEGFVGKLTQDVSATGEEIGEFFALDLSL